MITMFQVDHRDGPLPELPLQHVLDEGQRIAFILRLSIQAAVVDHKPPFPATFLGTSKQGEANSEGQGSNQPRSMNSLRILSVASSPSLLRANSRCRYESLPHGTVRDPADGTEAFH